MELQMTTFFIFLFFRFLKIACYLKKTRTKQLVFFSVFFCAKHRIGSFGHSAAYLLMSVPCPW